MLERWSKGEKVDEDRTNRGFLCMRMYLCVCMCCKGWSPLWRLFTFQFGGYRCARCVCVCAAYFLCFVSILPFACSPSNGSLKLTLLVLAISSRDDLRCLLLLCGCTVSVRLELVGFSTNDGVIGKLLCKFDTVCLRPMSCYDLKCLLSSRVTAIKSV